MPTRLGRFCEMIMEAGWLLAVVLIPLFFNIHTATVFEPNKAAILQTIVWVMVLAWAARFAQRPIGWIVDRLGRAITSARASRPRATEEYNPPEVIIEPVERGPRRLPQFRIALPHVLEVLAVLFALLVLVSTVTSCQGWASLLGAYQWAQGLLTLLSYVVIFLLAAGNLRGRAQVERLFLAITLGSLPMTAYAIAQALKIDPIPVGAKGNVASTLGNPLFLAGYLAAIMPLTLAGMLMVIAPLRGALRADRPRGLGFFAPVLGDLLVMIGIYLPALLLQLLALLFISAPFAILTPILAGLILIVFLAAAAFLDVAGRAPRLIGAALTAVGAAIIALVLAGVVGVAFVDEVPAQVLSLRGGIQQRALRWPGARAVITQWPLVNPNGDLWAPLRPVVGYGPETFAYPFNQVYPLALMQSPEGGRLVDRAHNTLLQVTAELGYLGLALYLTLLMGGFAVGLYGLIRGRSIYYRLALAGLLTALTAWVVYAQFYIVPTSVWLLFWLILGALVAVGRQARESAGATYRIKELEEPQRANAVFVGLLTLGAASVVFFLANFASVGCIDWGALPALLVGPWLALAILAAVVNNGLGFWQRRRLDAPASRGAWVAAVARVAWTVALTAGAVVAALISLGLVLLALYNLGSTTPANPQATPELMGALTLATAVVGVLVVAVALKRPAVPLQPVGWRSLVTFGLVTLSALALASILAGVIFLTVYQPTLADMAHQQALADDLAGQWARSIERHQQAVNLAPNQDWYYLFLGRAYVEYAKIARPDPSQSMEKAAAAFKQGQTVNPLNPDQAANLGRLYAVWTNMTEAGMTKEARVDQAGDAYEAAVKLTPHNTRLLREMADMYLKNSRLTEAARAFDRIVKLIPTDAEAWSYLGSIYAQQKKTDQAITAYQQVIQLQPNQYAPYLELAKVYQAAGEKDKALDMAKKALERAPDTARPPIQQLINELER